MKADVFSASDRTAVQSFLAEFKKPCSPSRIRESSAAWCTQFYVEEPAESLPLTRLAGSSMDVNSKESEILQVHGDMVCLSL